MPTLLLLNLSFVLAIMLIMLWILNHLPFDFLEGQKLLATMYVDIIQEQRLKYVDIIYTSLHNTGALQPVNRTVTLHLKVRARRLGLNNQKKKHITLHGTWLSFKYPTPVATIMIQASED